MAEREGDGKASVSSPVSSTVDSSAAAGEVSSPASPGCMTKISRHIFTDGRGCDFGGSISVDIIENIKEEYGMFVWPCAIALSEYVWQQRSRFLHQSVLELGGGTSLPGLLAAKVGADVTLTDDSRTLGVLDNMRRTCRINGLDCKILGLTWGEWDAALFDLRPNFLLGADVLYDNADFDDLFTTATFLMRNSPGCVFVTAYHHRSGHHLIEYLMEKWGCKCTRLVDAFSFVPPSKASQLHGSIQLTEIMLKNDDDHGSRSDEMYVVTASYDDLYSNYRERERERRVIRNEAK